ncbi:hypothetical protein Ctob_016566, partial [Chrysochromulina tobinii]
MAPSARSATARTCCPPRSSTSTSTQPMRRSCGRASPRLRAASTTQPSIARCTTN